MKECKIIELNYESSNFRDIEEKGIFWRENPDWDYVLTKYLNQGYSVKSITYAGDEDLLVYLERDI